ncbi:putative PEP-binding protein [Myxosarcina sp. GI1(2024)]
MNHLYWLSQIPASKKFLVGDNLSIVSQLLLNNCPILPGFVLDKSLLPEFLTSAFSESLIFNLSDLEVSDYRALQAIARHSRQAIADAALPPTWQEEIWQAARQLNSRALILSPYAVISRQRDEIISLWRSQTCWLAPEALEQALRRVWQELFTAKSLFYYRQLDLSLEEIGMAVLVQPLKAARASGTVEISPDVIHLQATEGLVQSLLWGEVQPDTYQLDRTGKIVARQLGSKNYAHRLSDCAEEQLETCLEAYIPDETRAENYLLTPQAITSIFESITTILHYHSQTKYLEWILEPSPVDDETAAEPQFYFTHLSDRLLWAIDQKNLIQSRSSPIQPLLTGLAASAGKIWASATVIADLNTSHSEAISPGCILVTKNVSPERIPVLKRLRGIITEDGGLTSHGAIIARELQIPAIVAAENATKIIAQGQNIFLDGDTGEVYLEAMRPQSLPSVEYPRFEAEISTRLMVNLSQPEVIEDVVNLPVAGVGLLRSELMLSELLTSEPLEVWQQAAKRRQFLDAAIALIEQFAAALAPRPVFYRSLDLCANQTELNPIVSSRGTYRYLFAPELFDLELQALLTVSQNYSNLNLILPFVRSIEEFKFCRRRVENIGLNQRESFQLWMMAEVPSVLFLLPEYVRAGVQGIAIGTNDLTQLLLGIDREQAHFSQQGLNETHPALELAIARLIATAKANNIPCSVCGQAPALYPELIDKLVEWGITSISVEPRAVRSTYEAIARAEKQLRGNG